MTSGAKIAVYSLMLLVELVAIYMVLFQGALQ